MQFSTRTFVDNLAQSERNEADSHSGTSDVDLEHEDHDSKHQSSDSL